MTFIYICCDAEHCSNSAFLKQKQWNILSPGCLFVCFVFQKKWKLGTSEFIFQQWCPWTETKTHILKILLLLNCLKVIFKKSEEEKTRRKHSTSVDAKTFSARSILGSIKWWFMLAEIQEWIEVLVYEGKCNIYLLICCPSHHKWLLLLLLKHGGMEPMIGT